MDKFDLIEAIIKRVDVLADARGAQKCAIVIEIIQQLGALRKGLADDDAAHKKQITDLQQRLDALNTTKEE
jgi:hypothetical protein